MTIEKTPDAARDAADPQRELISAVRSINRSAQHEVSVSGDDEPCYWQRREWVLWLLEMADAAEQALNERKPDGIAALPARTDPVEGAEWIFLPSCQRWVLKAPDGELLAELSGEISSGQLWNFRGTRYHGLDSAKSAAVRHLRSSAEMSPSIASAASGMPADLQKIIDELSVEVWVRVVMDDPLGKLLAKAGMALIGMRKALTTPIPMVLHCPECRAQHIDEPEEHDALKRFTEPPTRWENPPHRSHFCHACGCIWRPADVPTVGVKAIGTRGKADTFPARARSDEPKAGVA